MHYDLITRIKNAESAEKDSLIAIFSKVDFAIAKILAEAGYIKDVQKKSMGRKSFLEIKLARGGKAISGVKIISKPGRRMYIGSGDIRAVRQGYGLSIISTSRGVMNNKDAKKQKVGGEYLFGELSIQVYQFIVFFFHRGQAGAELLVGIADQIHAYQEGDDE